MMSDDQLDAAKALVMRAGTGSTSRLARELGVQYPHARRLMDRLEVMGTVSAADKHGGRRVIATVQG